MSKFFDDLMESVMQMDEILRRKQNFSRTESAPKIPLELKKHPRKATPLRSDGEK